MEKVTYSLFLCNKKIYIFWVLLFVSVYETFGHAIMTALEEQFRKKQYDD